MEPVPLGTQGIGGRCTIRQTTCNARPGRRATAATRSARHPHQASRRMEHRLRTVSRPRQRTSRPSIQRQHREPRAHGRRRGERHLYPVPLAGTTADDPLEGTTTTGRWVTRVGLRLADYWKLKDRKLGETDFYYFADGTAHKNRIRATISRRASCTGAASRLQLPGGRFHGTAQLRAAHQAGQYAVHGLPRPFVAGPAACGRHPSAHAAMPDS